MYVIRLERNAVWLCMQLSFGFLFKWNYGKRIHLAKNEMLGKTFHFFKQGFLRGHFNDSVKTGVPDKDK